MMAIDGEATRSLKHFDDVDSLTWLHELIEEHRKTSLTIMPEQNSMKVKAMTIVLHFRYDVLQITTLNFHVAFNTVFRDNASSCENSCERKL
jgi:hypothetical protein